MCVAIFGLLLFVSALKMVWRLPASLSLLLLFVNFEMICGLPIFRFAVVFVSFENDKGLTFSLTLLLLFVNFEMIWCCHVLALLLFLSALK